MTSLPCVYWNHEQSCLQSNFYIKIKHLDECRDWGVLTRKLLKAFPKDVKIVRSIITKYLLYCEEKALVYYFLGKIFSFMMWQGLHVALVHLHITKQNNRYRYMYTVPFLHTAQVLSHGHIPKIQSLLMQDIQKKPLKYICTSKPANLRESFSLSKVKRCDQKHLSSLNN